MSSPVYAQHRYSSIFVSETGHQHNRATADDGETPFAIECAACEPFLVKEGWVYHPAQVPLTDEQERRKERITRDGNAALKAFQERLADQAAEALVSGSDLSEARKRLQEAEAELARLEAAAVIQTQPSVPKAVTEPSVRKVKTQSPAPKAARRPRAAGARRRAAVTSA